MRFLTRSEIRPFFEGKSVAIVGSGPGVLDNEPGLVDSHDVVVRVNNFKLMPPVTGQRTDVHYSFYGNSIRKTQEELIASGVRLCMCKCPNSQPIESEWHRVNDKMVGVDFRYIYALRSPWWFCDTYVPTDEEFLEGFELLGRHIPTTGFAAILEILRHEPAFVYLTGFDFFESKVHNVDEAWKPGRADDPINHVPAAELGWLRENAAHFPITADKRLSCLLAREVAA